MRDVIYVMKNECYVLVDENNVHVVALDVLLETILNVGDGSIWKLKWNTIRDHS